jgi:hypothetical protein
VAQRRTGHGRGLQRPRNTGAIASSFAFTQTPFFCPASHPPHSTPLQRFTVRLERPDDVVARASTAKVVREKLVCADPTGLECQLLEEILVSVKALEASGRLNITRFLQVGGLAREGRCRETTVMQFAGARGRDVALCDSRISLVRCCAREFVARAVTHGTGTRACQAAGWPPSRQMKRDAPSKSLPPDANGARPSTTQWSSPCHAAVQNCNIVCTGHFSGTSLGRQIRSISGQRVAHTVARGVPLNVSTSIPATSSHALSAAPLFPSPHRL